MLTPRQTRAARALLGWTQQRLADEAVVALNAVARFEPGKGDPRRSTVEALERAFAQAGVELVPREGGEGEGVRLARPSGWHAKTGRDA